MSRHFIEIESARFEGLGFEDLNPSGLKFTISENFVATIFDGNFRQRSTNICFLFFFLKQLTQHSEIFFFFRKNQQK